MVETATASGGLLMSITWQMNDRDTLNDVLIEFETSLAPRASNHLGVHLEGEGPEGAQAVGLESNPTTFWIVATQEPEIDLRGLSGTRGRRYDFDWQLWSEPSDLERILRTEGQALLTFLDTVSDTGWKWFLEDARVDANTEYNADLAGRSIMVPAFVGAS